MDKLGACSVTEPNKNRGFFSQKHGCKDDWGGEYYYTDNDDRYYYNAVPLKFTASFLTDTSNGNLANPFGGRIPLETKSPEQMKTDATSYKFYHNLTLVIASIVVLAGMAVLGYNWVMSDGKWSTKDDTTS